LDAHILDHLMGALQLRRFLFDIACLPHLLFAPFSAFSVHKQDPTALTHFVCQISIFEIALTTMLSENVLW
jgi:hypothetical protein